MRGFDLKWHTEWPNIYGYLLEVFLDKDIFLSFLNWFSKLFNPSAERKLAIFYGPAMTGKSTLLKFIELCIPGFAYVLPSDFYLQSNRKSSANPSVMKTKDNRVVVFCELAKTFTLNEKLLLDILSEKITARGLYQGFETFCPTAQLIFTTNHASVIHNDCLLEKTVVFPFEIEFERKNHSKIFNTRLPEEIPAFVARMKEFSNFFEDIFESEKGVLAKKDFQEAL